MKWNESPVGEIFSYRVDNYSTQDAITDVFLWTHTHTHTDIYIYIYIYIYMWTYMWTTASDFMSTLLLF